MEAGVEKSFEKICADNGMDWHEVRSAFMPEGRYHIETY